MKARESFGICVIVFLLFLLILGSQTVFSAEPRLFFSDLVNGPKKGWEGSQTKGAAVTIWGRNFGAGGTITCAGQTLSSADSDKVAEWGATTAPTTARGLERITFWLNSTMSTGSQTIYVTVGGVNSNTLPFTVRETGNIYFVSVKDGNNGYDGAYSTYQSGSHGPWKDISKISPYNNSSLRPGDCFYIKGGTYTQLDADNAFMKVRNATYMSGTVGNSYAVATYPGETANFDGSRASRGFNLFDECKPEYWTFSKLQFTNGYVAFNLIGDHNRAIGNSFNDMLESAWSGVIWVSNAQYTKIYGNYFNHCGRDKYKHNIYAKTQPGASPNLPVQYLYIGWNEFHNSYSSDGYGGTIFLSKSGDAGGIGDTLHIYIHDNYFHAGNCGDFIYVADNVSTVGDIYIYNNIFSGGTSTNTCIYWYLGSGTGYMYNNTFYLVTPGHPIVSMFRGSGNLYSKNNIFYANPGQILFNKQSDGGNWYSDYDLFYNSPTPIGATNSVNGDPLFVTNGSNFSLQESSPAKDAGTSDVETALEYDVPGSISQATDYAGIERPRNGIYDIGAFESADIGAVPTGPEILLLSLSHDFGSVVLGAYSDWTMIIRNLGTEALLVSSASAGNGDFVVTSPSFPRSVSAGGTLNAVVRFSPSTVGVLSASLRIDSNDFDEGTVTVSVTGVGTSGAGGGDTIAPVAEAGPNRVAVVGQAVNFDGAGSWDNVGIASYRWDFDSRNGIQIDAAGVAASHVFSSAGTYSVTLTVDDAAGNGPVSDTLVVTVEESAAGGAVTKSFGDSTGADYLGACTDTYVNIGDGGSLNYANDTQFLTVYTWPVNTAANRALLKWDLSSVIPSGATIHSAVLYLYMFSSVGDAQYDVSVHKVINHNPVIGSATWNTFNGVNAWTGGANGGAQDMAAAEDTKTLDITVGYKFWNVTSMVQDWVNSPASNLGMMLDADKTASSGSNRAFRPSEYSNPDQRPKLVVVYSLDGSGVVMPSTPAGLHIIQ